MFQLVKLISNTLYMTIITIYRFWAQVCSIFKRAQSGPSMGDLTQPIY